MLITDELALMQRRSVRTLVQRPAADLEPNKFARTRKRTSLPRFRRATVRATHSGIGQASLAAVTQTLTPDLDQYALLFGPWHFHCSDEPQQAVSLLCDFAWLWARLGRLPASTVEWLTEDLMRALATATTSATQAQQTSLAAWLALVRTDGALLRRGEPSWPSARILLQRALETPGPCSRAAECWLADVGHEVE
jgi:hypothetical protein